MAHTPLKLLPSIAVAGRARARQLNQNFSAYVAILIHNQSVRPAALPDQPYASHLIRVHVPCSWKMGLRPLAARLAREAGVSVNSLIEYLIAAELLSPSADLAIRANATKPKLQL